MGNEIQLITELAPFVDKIGVIGVLIFFCIYFSRKAHDLEKKNNELNEIIKTNQKDFDNKLDEVKKDTAEIRTDVKRVKDRINFTYPLSPNYPQNPPAINADEPTQRRQF